MTTFSQLVDDVVSGTARTNKQADIARFINQVIREVHTDETGGAIVYSRNLVETTITATTATTYVWPVPQGLQSLLTVSYPDLSLLEGGNVFPDFIRPGRRQNDSSYFYYRSGSSFVFYGFGDIGDTISVAYYLFPPRLQYYASGARPATYDSATQTWTYYDLSGSGGINYDEDDDSRELARDLTSNWILLDWEDMVAWGAKASLYALAGDERAAVHYSKFNILRRQMMTSESVPTLQVNGT